MTPSPGGSPPWHPGFGVAGHEAWPAGWLPSKPPPSCQPAWGPTWYPVPPGYPGHPGWVPYALPPHPAHPYLATTGERIGARLIDLIIEITVVLLVGLSLLSLVDLRPLLDPRGALTWVQYLLVSAPLLVGVVYALATEGRTGQTLGKRALGIRVVKIDGRPFRWTDALVRWLCLGVDNQLAILGLVLIATRPYKQRVGDLAAGTIVVRAR